MPDFVSPVHVQKDCASRTIKKELVTEPASEVNEISPNGSPEPQPSPLVSNEVPELPQNVTLEELSEIRRLLEQLQQAPPQNESLSKVHMDVVEKLVKVSMENGALKSEMTALRKKHSAAITNQRLRIQSLERDNFALKKSEKKKCDNLEGAKKRKLDESPATPAAPRGTFAGQVAAIVHAGHCQEANCSVDDCASTKKSYQHVLTCTKRANGECLLCGHFQAMCWYHSESCSSGECPVPFCYKFRKNFK